MSCTELCGLAGKALSPQIQDCCHTSTSHTPHTTLTMAESSHCCSTSSAHQVTASHFLSGSLHSSWLWHLFIFQQLQLFPHTPQIIPGTHCDPEQPNLFLHAGGNCGFSSFWVRGPRRQEGWQVQPLAWNSALHGHSSSLFPGWVSGSCLPGKSWLDVRWVVSKFWFVLGGKWWIPCESMACPRPLRGCL